MPGMAATDANSIISAEVRNTAYTGPATLYLSLHTAEPGSVGANEVTGGSYVRQAITFNAPSSGITTNSGTLTFASMPTANVTHVGLWDASTAGTFHQSGQLNGTISVASGNTVQFSAGQLTYTVTGT